ncbi:MAG TPA: hypothetical protein VL991_11945 [Terracidiphilus sp.]|nr:hypothetical protein [Terracidiphilus sp.]
MIRKRTQKIAAEPPAQSLPAAARRQVLETADLSQNGRMAMVIPEFDQI